MTHPAPAIDRRSTRRGPSTCQQLGICKDRYPNCGRCDDEHPEDEPPTQTPFEQMWYWLGVLAKLAVATVIVCMAAGYFVAQIAHMGPTT